MKAGRKFLAALVIALAALFAPPARSAAAPPADSAPVLEAREAAAAALRSGRLQTKLPADTQEEDRSSRRGFLSFLSPDALRIMFWAAVIIIAVILLKNFRNNVWSASRSRRLTHADQENSAPAAAVRLEQAQAEADELAERGSFAEAMHVLLLRGVNELRRRLGTPIAASLTSREILRRLTSSPAEQSHFAGIVASVEISYFGPHQPEEEDYLRCRRDFEALVRILRQEGGQ